MNRNILVSVLAAAGTLVMFTSCNSGKAKVSGNIVGAPNKKITLEMVSVGGSPTVDTIVTDAKGNFKFAFALPSTQATLYNLKINGEYIPLFISPGERITVDTFYESPRSYAVAGSPESGLLHEITDILREGTLRLDSLARAQSLLEGDKGEIERNTREYIREYHRIKRSHIAFIITNKGSLAAIYALNQRLPNDEDLFTGENDIIYYRTVAEEVELTYPNSPYVAALKRDIANYESEYELLGRLQRAIDSEPLTFPEIEMSDIYGKAQKLTDRKGKVIILDFWSLGFDRASVVNAEYRELYSELHGKGLEIFQVSVDSSRPDWVSAVQDQRLPWTTLFDTKGSGLVAARLYNVTSVPSNYLISASGDIVARDLYGDDLRRAVEKEIKRGR